MNPNATRVQQHTIPEINERIQRGIEKNVRLYSCASPELLERRLQELDREWDVERTFERNAAMAAAVGTILGLTWKRGFFVMPLVASSFLVLHAVHGWAPPINVLRAMGVRTRGEIESERHALKAVRGDYVGLPAAANCQPETDAAPFVEAAQR